MRISRGLPARAGDAHPEVDLAALEFAAEALAQPGFQSAQLVGQPELEIEVTMIDRADLDGQRAAG